MTASFNSTLKFLTKLLASVMVVLLLFLIVTSEVEADGSLLFEGTGQGKSETQDAEECSQKGDCEVEIQGTFKASDDEIGEGTVRFRFADDWSGISSGASQCSVPAAGNTTFIWETSAGDGLIMTQTSGYICPSPARTSGEWKRFLRVDRGTGKFAGARGTVFLSGRTNLDTGETDWTFKGWLTLREEKETGCFRAYLVGGLLMLPPKGAPPPGSVDFVFWLCGDDITISGPNPRKGYEIFNPQN